MSKSMLFSYKIFYINYYVNMKQKKYNSHINKANLRLTRLSSLVMSL